MMRRGVRSAALGWMEGLSLRGLLRLPRPDGFDLLIIAVSALGAALVLARTLPYGVGLHHDSLNYIEVARNALAGEGFANYDGTIHTIFPPGYPLLLAAAGLGIVDPRDVAGPLNAVLFGLTILVAGLYLRGRLETRFLALWACLAIALATPLADLARFAMPDMPFILFATLALIQTDSALRNDSRSALVWAAVFCAVAWQIRYIGAAVPALTGLALLMQGGMPPLRRARRAALFAAGAGAPMALWLLRNYLARGSLFTGHGGVALSLTDILRDGAQILAGWGQPLPGWLFGIVFAALTLSLCVFMARGSGACARRACLIFGGFGLAYAASLGAAAALGYSALGVHPRYVVPLYVPLVVVATFALDGLFNWARARRESGSAGRLPIMRTFVWGWVFRLDRLLAIALGVGLCAWIAVQVVANADHIARANAGELHLRYGGPRWTESETLRYARERLSGAVIYTNAPLLAHFHSDGNADYRGLSEWPLSPGQVARWATRNDGAYVVWLYDHNPEPEFKTMNAPASDWVEPVGEFADGEAFRLSAARRYRQAYKAAIDGDYGGAAARSNFDLYLNEDAESGTLVYVKEPCGAEDTQARFFLHIFPEDESDLLAESKPHGFANLDFQFADYGVELDGICVAMRGLPQYEIERIITGQHVSGEGALWKARVAVSAGRRYRQAHKAASDGDYGGAAAQSKFDVYLDAAAAIGRLIYVKERCAAEDTRARFFLHIIPSDEADLPSGRKPSGFDNMDFRFAEYGTDLGEACVAVRDLPQYGVERVRTGQFVSGEGAVWRVEFGVDGRE